MDHAVSDFSPPTSAPASTNNSAPSAPVEYTVDEVEDTDPKSITPESEVRSATAWENAAKGQYFPIGATVASLPSRRYKPRWSNQHGSMYMANAKVFSDRLHPSTAVEKVLEEVREFWEQREKYRQRGFVWKRNLLLFGPPGTGKSCILESVARFFLEQNGIVVMYDQMLPIGLGPTVGTVRKWEPTRPILLLLEDIDSTLQNYPGFESELLQFLDGYNRVENVVTMATTNFAAKLPKRVVRYGRFDEVFHIPQPDRKSKMGYLRGFDEAYFTDEVLAAWMKETQGLTFAELKEAVLQVLVKGRSLEAACRDIGKMDRFKETPNVEAKPGARGEGHFL